MGATKDYGDRIMTRELDESIDHLRGFISHQFSNGIEVTPDLHDYLFKLEKQARAEKRWAKSRRIRFTCWFSRKFFDIHDYKVTKGGDGIPSHFHNYHCWNCGKKFGI